MIIAMRANAESSCRSGQDVSAARRPRQNDFGRPSTWVATWLRIRLVEMGATW
jgi:hypothetical protein